ncbi:MAG: hypothetical protein NTZ68_04260 [Candidatus Dependentiae bacterium]|nr:hypothetical protein [Candidatus Dependentiae bacterium]
MYHYTISAPKVEPLNFEQCVSLIAHQTHSQPKIYRSGYKLACPAHDDRHPSLAISQGDDGKILIYCFSGCTIDDICTSLNINKKDLFPPRDKGASYG